MSLIKNIQHTLVFRSIMFGTGFLTSIIIARTLRSSGLGIFTVVSLIPAIVASIISLGIDTANTYFIGKKKYTSKETASNSISISLLLIILGIIVSLLFATCFGFVPHDVSRVYIYIAVCIIPFDVLNRLLSGIIFGLNRIRRMNVIRLTSNICLVVCLVIFLVVLKAGITGALISGIIAMIVNVVLVFRELPDKDVITLKPDLKWLKDVLLYGLQERTGAILNVLVARADVFLIVYFLGLSPLGYYAISYKVFMMFVQIPLALFYVLFPKISTCSHEEANKTIPAVCRNTVFMILIITIATLIIIKPVIIFFYGDEFRNSIIPIVILLPGAVFLSIVYVIQAYFDGLGRPQYYIYLSLEMLTINILLNIAFIPLFGINGAAIATVASYLSGSCLSLYLYHRMSGENLRNILILNKKDIFRYTEFVKSSYIKIGALYGF